MGSVGNMHLSHGSSQPSFKVKSLATWQKAKGGACFARQVTCHIGWSVLCLVVLLLPSKVCRVEGSTAYSEEWKADTWQFFNSPAVRAMKTRFPATVTSHSADKSNAETSSPLAQLNEPVEEPELDASQANTARAELDNDRSSERPQTGRRLLVKRQRGGATLDKPSPEIYGPWSSMPLAYIGSQMRRHYRFLDAKAESCGLVRNEGGVRWNDFSNYDNLTRWRDPAIPGAMFDHTVSFRYLRGRRWRLMSRRHTDRLQCLMLQRGVDYEELRSGPLVQGRPFDGPKRVPPVKPDNGLTMIAVVFPQYHAFAHNNMFWGTNFTEWSNLQLAWFNPWNFQAIKHPIATHGGYYNFLDRSQRRRVGRLARHYGIEGLAYHHYWYNCNTRFMEQPLLRLLEDGEPSLPFAFIWANHRWTRHWDGHNGEVIQDQTYGDETCWRLHFQWLLPFFRHSKYIKVDGKPVFMIYVLFEIPESTFRGMVSLWREMAVDAGLPGLHLVECLNREDTEASPLVDAVMEYHPNMRRAYISQKVAMPPQRRLHHNYYRGEYIGWDNFPRHNSNPSYQNGGFDDDPIHVEARLRQRMAVARKDPNTNAPNFFFLTAWNEWGEGNNLEPDNIYGYGALNALAWAYEGSRQTDRRRLTEKELLGRLTGFMAECNLVLDLFFYSQVYCIDFRQFQAWSDWGGPDTSDSLNDVKGRTRSEKLVNHWREVGFFKGREFKLRPNKDPNEGWTMPSTRECKHLTNTALDKVVVRFYLEDFKEFDHYFL